MREIKDHFESKINQALKMDKFEKIYMRIPKASQKYLDTIYACINELTEQAQ